MSLSRDTGQNGARCSKSAGHTDLAMKTSGGNPLPGDLLRSLLTGTERQAVTGETSVQGPWRAAVRVRELLRLQTFQARFAPTYSFLKQTR